MARRPRRKGGTMKDGERRQLAYASRRAGVPLPQVEPGDRVRVLCDGGSRGNPGPAAVAAVVVDADGTELARRARRIGRATAAEAEYRAILLGLQLAAGAGPGAIEVRSDSQLAIDRLRAGDGPVEVVESAGAFTDVRWVWHPRADIEAVDALVRELLWPRFGGPDSGHQPRR
jgi:ribonuclease HI